MSMISYINFRKFTSMKKIIIVLGFIVISANIFAQIEIKADYADIDVDLTVRDTTIIDLIEEHTSSSVVGAYNGLTKVGSNIGLGGTISNTTLIGGAGNVLHLGTPTSKVSNFSVNSSDNISLNTDNNIIFSASGATWELDGNYWVSASGDTLATKAEIQTLINANARILPFNYKYIFSAITTDARPGQGYFRLNQGVLSSVTEMYIDYYDSDIADKSEWLDFVDSGSVFTVQRGATYAIYQSNNTPVDNGNYFTFGVAYKGHNGVLSGLNTIDISLSGSGGSGGSADSLLVSSTDTVTLIGSTLSANNIVADVLTVDTVYNHNIALQTATLNIISSSGTSPTINFTQTTPDSRITIGNVNVLGFSSSGIKGGSASADGNWELFNRVATATVPNFTPKRTDGNTGIGWGGTDQLSLIAGGVETVRVTDSSIIVNDNIVGKTVYVEDSIYVNNGWITGVNDSGYLEIDSISTNNFSVGGSAYVDTIMQLSDALSEETRETFFGNITNIGSTSSVVTVNLSLDDLIIAANHTDDEAVVLQLMSAQTTSGRMIIVSDTDGNAGTNNITITTESTEKINGQDSYTINSNYGSIRLYSDGANWFTY